MAIHRRCHPSSRQRTYSEGGQQSGWAGFRPSLGRALQLRFVGISVAMYELPLPVLAAIDLGHPQIERYGLILSAHVCLGALEADPGDVAGDSRVERLECILTAAGEPGCVPSKATIRGVRRSSVRVCVSYAVTLNSESFRQSRRYSDASPSVLPTDGAFPGPRSSEDRAAAF